MLNEEVKLFFKIFISYHAQYSQRIAKLHKEIFLWVFRVSFVKLRVTIQKLFQPTGYISVIFRINTKKWSLSRH